MKTEFDMEVLQRMILSLTEISSEKSKRISELEETLKTIQVENKELKKEFEKISMLKEKLDTLETEKIQLKRINQGLREESRKCCNFVAHIQQSYTIEEKDAIPDNGHRKNPDNGHRKKKLKEYTSDELEYSILTLKNMKKRISQKETQKTN